jgi:hypothetical protein
MALTRRGELSYGDGQSDIVPELERYSELNGYPATRFGNATCSACACTRFRVAVDEEAGVAARTCSACEAHHYLADSLEYADEAEEALLECVCGGDELEVTVGLALYADSDDVRWFYLGCRCPGCGLVGCYADYKAELGDAKQVLRQI